MKDNVNKDTLPPWECPLFIGIITFIGGYMNGYTYITRNGILANMHTANMSKLGIQIAVGDFGAALGYFYPILSCILGAAFSELIKFIISHLKLKGDWRKYALILEGIFLFLIGLVPTFIPDYIITYSVSFFMGYQLCLFRTCLGVAFNTTICTGNLRNVGQLLFKAADDKTKTSINKFLTFTILTFSFVAGTTLGTLISLYISIKAVWICSIIIFIQSYWMYIYENKSENTKEDRLF